MSPPAADHGDSYFCVCDREDCFCMSMIPIDRVPAETLRKMLRLDADYLLPCARCAAGTHDLDPKTAAHRQTILRREIVAQLERAEPSPPRGGWHG